MKFFLLLMLTACASRFENFKNIHPGMSKVDLRSEMSMVEGILTWPPYEFRTYSSGMVVLKDDKVMQIFEAMIEEDFNVEFSATGGKSMVPDRFFIPEVAGQEVIYQQLRLLLRVRGYTVLDKASASSTIVTIKVHPHRLILSAKNPTNEEAFWLFDGQSDSESAQNIVLPAILAVAVDNMNVQLPEDKKVEVRSTHVTMNIARHAVAVNKILANDITLKD